MSNKLRVKERLSCILAGMLAVAAATEGSLAATLSDPSVDAYNMRVGTETFAGMYKFTTNTLLVETAEAMTNMGSDVIKFYLGTNTSGQSGITLPSNVNNLITLARDEPSYHRVLDMGFRHFILWAYPFANPDEWWGSGYNATQGAKDYNEMYALTRYLLTNYNNSGKTFYLGHWEGDGYLSVSNWSTNPAPATIQGMIGWLNNRQQAVDDAKRATAYTNVSVFNYTECNRVRDAMLNNSNNNQRVINYVLPYVTNIDYLSYSSYDAQNLSASDLYTTLNYMQAHLPTNKASVVPGERMWIGEFGWGSQSTAAQEPLIRSYIQRLMGWNYNGQCLPYILYWEMYSNYNPGGGTNYCLIDYHANKVPAWYLDHYFYNCARLLVAQFLQANGRLPTDTEFTSLVSPMLNAPLQAPIPLTVANLSSALVSTNSASVSGTLVQGVYGDQQASVWVFWGLQDGGTVRGAWDQSLNLGFNTNFSLATFTGTLANLLPNTNYFFRFYATNSSGEAWAPVTSQLSTLMLNPHAYNARLNIQFAGYNRGEALGNFPVLVTLSTNLPGFSYRQFASPTGGDLRFTDGSGLSLIPSEVDEWNTNGTSTVWVDVPTLSGPTNSIWAYWGNPIDATPLAWSTNGAVWSNCDFVYHLKETGFPYMDSAQQYPALSGNAPASNPGIIGHGASFNGTSSYLNSGVVNVGTAFTLSAWVNLDPSSTNIQGIIANKATGWNSDGFGLFINTYNTSDHRVLVETGDGTGGTAAQSIANAVTPGRWHRIAASLDEVGGTSRIYVDGTDVTQSSPIATDFANQATVNLGRFTNSVYYFKGAMDEVRIESGIKSSNWVWASYMTASANPGFQSYAAVAQQQPPLSFSSAGNGGLTLSWPGSGVGFALCTSTNLSLRGGWTLTTNEPVWSNSQWQISLPADGSNARFFRLAAQ
jgi:hypothetical protein